MKILKGFKFVTEVPEGYDEIRFIGNDGDMIAVSADKPAIMFDGKDWKEIKPIGPIYSAEFTMDFSIDDTKPKRPMYKTTFKLGASDWRCD